MQPAEAGPAIRIVLVGGGARSGKSRFALAHARTLGARRAFVATGQALDGEMERRIAEHARTRGADFRTIEEPLRLPEALLALREADAEIDVVVVDCLTLWLSNLIVAGEPEDVVAERVAALAAVLRRRAFHAVIVTNEVGMGIVPETPLGRLFRDVAGRAHQQLAAAADEIYLAAVGVVLRLRPDPVLTMPATAGGETREGREP